MSPPLELPLNVLLSLLVLYVLAASAREVAKDEKHLADVGVRLHYTDSPNMAVPLEVACYSNYLY